MRRFILFLILFFGISFLFYIILSIDFKPVTISISGYVLLEDMTSPEGIKVEVVTTYHKAIFRKPIKHFFADAIGFYQLEEINAPKGSVGEIFLLWLDGRKEKAPYLKLRITKKGYLTTEVLILKWRPIIKIPMLSLDREGTRRPLNEIIAGDEIKIIKNVTKYKFCALHDYLWFYPEYYDLEIRIPTDDKDKNVQAKLRLIIAPRYTNFEEELNKSTPRLKNLIRLLIPEISAEEIKSQGGVDFANSLSNPSLVDKLNEILIDSKITYIHLTSIELVKRSEGGS
ncbi:MAG: hypothetical protein QME42_02025 [bacterium]|nr:hypothetical protein [bacterium]